MPEDYTDPAPYAIEVDDPQTVLDHLESVFISTNVRPAYVASVVMNGVEVRVMSTETFEKLTAAATRQRPNP